VRSPDLEVRVLLSDADVLVDLPILVQSSVRTGGSEVCAAGMSAHVAWALARCAELQPGERVLDPMCGAGVILVEAAMCWPNCSYIGVDIDESQLLCASSNCLLAARSVELLNGDAQHLPFPSDSIDVLICDIPFGRQYSTIEECRNGLYTKLLLEFNRVVKSECGRMVLLSSLEQEPWVLHASGLGKLENEAGEQSGVQPWVCIARRSLMLGFLEAVVLVFKRKDETTSAGLPAPCNRLWWETSGGRNDWASLKVSQRPPMQLARGREI